MKYIFAGDRDIALSVLSYLMQQGYEPAALLVSGEDRASHAEELISLSRLPQELIFRGVDFKAPGAIALFEELQPDYIIGIHFPYIIRKEVLNIPKIGFLNLHPAYLPYNRGWHTPTWAILEGTPIGATLHFMSEELDAGDIIHQKQLDVLPNDTANSLYRRLKDLELDVFKEAFPSIIKLEPNGQVQNLSLGTSHNRKDLFKPEVQEINLEEEYKAGELLKKLRALTTNSLAEAAYFEKNGKKYRVQIQITEEKNIAK
ncbi:methionyl-tRNA formyltransferase [Pontibacter vulgaris]|uniref:methionyl-tRNA formyltransferase n=1 Tax=Pontibacter vulgaris TaxID=2905679 RepID=UPI001FA7BA02|nr:formyltransferase family protein [Pontibacter vulgaris]